MPISIPIPNDTPFFSTTVELDGTDYVLTFQYVQREARFLVSIATNEGVDLAIGAACVVDWPLFLNRRNAKLPPGCLMIRAQGADDSPPGLTDFGPGKRCELMYHTAAEMGLG